MSRIKDKPNRLVQAVLEHTIFTFFREIYLNFFVHLSFQKTFQIFNLSWLFPQDFKNGTYDALHIRIIFND